MTYKTDKIIIDNELYKDLKILNQIGIEKQKIYLEKYNIKIEELRKFSNRYLNRRYRLYKRIKLMIGRAKKENKDIYFVTYTINNDNLNKDHKRKLKELHKNQLYVFNIDYGNKNNRKHYHGIIVGEPKKWTYGFTKFIKININLDAKKISKYIFKLTNHALKSNTEFEKIIYSRKY